MPSSATVERLLEDLERLLLTPHARKSSRVSDLLAEEFVEFGSSGSQYDKAQVVAALQGEDAAEIVASEFKVRLLAPNVALVTYRAKRGSESPVQTLRASIWRQREGQWQLVFHQGTVAGAQT